MDLGSDLETLRLLERFKQARPHFTVSSQFLEQEEPSKNKSCCLKISLSGLMVTLSSLYL